MPTEGLLSYISPSNTEYHNSMAQCKTAVTPLLMHWSYCSLGLDHRYGFILPYDVSWNCNVITVTHWGLNKMDAILQMAFSNAFYWKESFSQYKVSSLKNHQGMTGLGHSLVCKPLLEPKLAQFTGACMCGVSVLICLSFHGSFSDSISHWQIFTYPGHLCFCLNL